MDPVVKWLAGAAVVVMAGALPGFAAAEDAADLMKSRLGTTNADPVIVEAFSRAARPVTPESRQGDRVLEQQRLRYRHWRQDQGRLR